MAQDITIKERPFEVVRPPEQKPGVAVLVVDDDPMVLDLLAEYLRGNGYNVLTAGSGEEAVSKMRSATLDIALVDLKMPGMDGLETIEQMTGIDPEAVTILMTGFPTLDSSVKAIKLGASDYILKPFKLEEVNLAVNKAAREREVRREVKSLKKRVTELEKGISDKKESIKINQKVDIVNTPEGYAARISHLQESPKKQGDK